MSKGVVVRETGGPYRFLVNEGWTICYPDKGGFFAKIVCFLTGAKNKMASMKLKKFGFHFANLQVFAAHISRNKRFF